MQSGVVHAGRAASTSMLRNRRTSSAMAEAASAPVIAAGKTPTQSGPRRGALLLTRAAGDAAGVRRNESFQLGDEERQSVKESWDKIVRWSRLNQLCASLAPMLLLSLHPVAATGDARRRDSSDSDLP